MSCYSMKGAILYALYLFPAFVTPVFGSDCINYVDTRIGTAASTTKSAGKFGKSTEEYGQTLPAVLEPNGMNFWTPQTQDSETKCIAPYYYKDSLIQGFRNSHWIVGGCTQDYGSMTLMSTTGKLKCLPSERGGLFSHNQEITTPSYYAVQLKNYGIRAEMTGQCRSAIFRFTYSADGDAYLIVNPNSDEGKGYIEIDVNKKEIRGYNPVHRIYQGWGEPAGFSGYFVVKFTKEIESYGVYLGAETFVGQSSIGGKPNIGVFIHFKVNKNEQILVKSASSFTAIEAARNNLTAEIPDWNFDAVKSKLTNSWEQKLASIKVETSDKEKKIKFYSALYRSSFLPRVMNNVDGSYPSFSTGTPTRKKAKGNYYDDFSMWDTYRALHPLLNIIAPDKSAQMMQSLVDKYEQGGWLPIFPCWNSYTAAMIGDHAIAVLGDAYVKGITDFDIQKAYEGMRKNAFESPADFRDYKNGMGRRALKSYLKYGYIPLEDSVKEAFHKNEQVSRTLEYAYDDYVLAQVALKLGKTNDYQKLIVRAHNYSNVIDPTTGYAQGRFADGRFLNANNAFNFAGFVTEGAPCHYTWYVPQDIKGLMGCMGGKAMFTAKLDSMFSEHRYWHGNEPCHQIAFLFNYAGQPWKTQQQVRHILNSEYSNTPGGLSGNDDAGQMSAWSIFAAMGFYPVCPGTPYYVLASPSFPKVSILLEHGKTFTITTKNASDENIYIQSVTLNGRQYTKNYISHADIVSGAKLNFVMGKAPNKNWGTKPEDCPPSMTK